MKPAFVGSWLEIYRKGGLKQLFKERGWKIVLAFFLFYLIRDSFLYILVPYIGYSQVSSCF
ncbi:uncharacterized protein METZ01_LOCUS56874 [marine metagenome]|uniref:Uncharacterized protein n=1 Tax=marine metagenome TaxID=408172 RepID=A0A381SIX9_9ZZZZ